MAVQLNFNPWHEFSTSREKHAVNMSYEYSVHVQLGRSHGENMAGTARAPPVSQRAHHSIKYLCFMYTKIKYGNNGLKVRFRTSNFSEDFKQVVRDFVSDPSVV